MGISGLLTLLKSIQRPCNLQKFNGLTLGVDAYVWLHRGTMACTVDLALDKPTAKFVDFAMSRVRMLIHFGIVPYIVFDGDYLPSKGVTEEARAKRRHESRALGLQLLRAGKTAQAHAELKKAVDVTPEMAGQLMEELRKHNIQFVVAPYEADAQLVYLERQGIVQGIISEDSDLLVFGARRLLTKLDQYGECIEINRDHFPACKGVSLVGWTDTEFRRMAILSGCDYLPNMNRLGLKTAYSLVRRFQTPERIIQRLQFDAAYTVPEDYLEKFRKAELTFLHQWVFCPKAKKLVMSTPLEKCDLNDLSFLGKDLDPTVARGVAAGRLHPTTKKPLAIKSVPLRNAQSPWGAARNSAAATPAAKIGKPIDQYFKNKRVPLAELDPNTFTPSPSQSILLENANRSWMSTPATGSPAVLAPPTRTPNVRGALASSNAARQSPAVPSKRPRLCSDDDGAGAAAHTQSRFFSSPKASPLLSRSSRRKTQNERVSIWSDDSIDEALAQMPDISAPINPHVTVYREGADQQAEVAGDPTSQASLLTEASFHASTSTQTTSASLVDGVTPASDERQIEGETPPSKEQPQEETPKKLGWSRFCSHTESVDVVPESPQVTKQAVTSGERRLSHTGSAVGRTVIACSVSGSEDLLVPHSDTESAPASPTSVCSLTAPKLDLGRFRFTGQ